MPGPDTASTFFAPALRATTAELRLLSDEALNNPVACAVLEAVCGMAFILNEHRQILAANTAVLAHAGDPSLGCVLGQRPGELFDCVHVAEGPGGCGTGQACRTCGAVRAILDRQATGETVTGDCVMTTERRGRRETVEFRVRAMPLAIAGHDLTVLVMHDISAGKRSAVLQRVFLHDIAHLLSGIVEWSNTIHESPEAVDAARNIIALAERLRHEFEVQHALVEAEAGILRVRPEDFCVPGLFAHLKAMFQLESAEHGKPFQIMPVAEKTLIHADRALLTRALVNLLKNAFEANAPGQSVVLWYERHGDRARFCVQNPVPIPQPIALRMFERGNSTKGATGRGMGTYCVKLFLEDYLHGRAGFRTSEGDGAVFWIDLPVSPIP
ncbi:MAG: HAMP domain-containing histidine kinase [Candidatus Hydrogenedentes bacterium]|nr:HAMP domain-containing histidine kinase [Candidatus Hydrogenedentota bacterium]